MGIIRNEYSFAPVNVGLLHIDEFGHLSVDVLATELVTGGFSLLNTTTTSESLTTGFPSYPTVGYTRRHKLLSHSIEGQTWYIEFYNELRMVEVEFDIGHWYIASEMKVRVGKGISGTTITYPTPIHRFAIDFVYLVTDADPLGTSSYVGSSFMTEIGALLQAMDSFVFYIQRHATYLVNGLPSDVYVPVYVDGIAFSPIAGISSHEKLAVMVQRNLGDGSFYNAHISLGPDEDLSLISGPGGDHTYRDFLLQELNPADTSQAIFKEMAPGSPLGLSGADVNVPDIWPILCYYDYTTKPRRTHTASNVRTFQYSGGQVPPFVVAAMPDNENVTHYFPILLAGIEVTPVIIHNPPAISYFEVFPFPTWTTNPAPSSTQETHNKVLEQIFPINIGHRSKMWVFGDNL